MNCARCGAVMNPGENFCGKCGAPLNTMSANLIDRSEPQAPLSPTPGTIQRAWIYALGGVLAVIVFAAAGVVAYRVFLTRQPEAQSSSSATSQARQPNQPPASGVHSAPNSEELDTSSHSVEDGPGRALGQRWTIYPNDTVLDKRTGLMWTKKDFRTIEGRFVKGWDEAMAWARRMNSQHYSGHDDWRVPSIAEYKTIRDKDYRRVFDSMGEDVYWSRNEISRWVASYISMSEGYAVSGSKEEGANRGSLYEGKFSVRLVRNTN
jgi:Protein of unknown function (DUF1566)